MATVLADRVQETTVTTGTGTLTVAGPSPQYQSFVAGVGNGNTTYYALLDGNGIGWEVGTTVVGSTTLTRPNVLASSNAGAAINLSSNTHTVFCDVSASLATLLLSIITYAAGTGININSGSIIALAPIGPSLLFGNSATTSAVATGITLGTNLSFSGATLNASATTTLAAGSLFCKSGTISAAGSAIAIGANLTLASGTLSAAAGGSGIATLIAAGITSSATSVALPDLPVISGLPTMTTWINQNSATETAVTNGPLTYFTSTISGGSTNTVRYKAASGAFTLITNISGYSIAVSNGPTFGICLTDGTKLVTFDVVEGRTFATGFAISLWNSFNSFNTGLLSTINFTTTTNIWQRIVSNGSGTYTFSISLDGRTWMQLFSTGSLGLTVSGAGIVINTINNNADGMVLSLNYWSGV